MPQADLCGRVAVVTGALGKLGPVWCKCLASAGASVIGLDLQSAIDRAGPAAGNAGTIVWPCDITDRAEMEAVRARCESQYGNVSILVNNAGIDAPPAAGARHRLEDVPVAALREVFEVNTFAAMQAMQVFGGGMVARRAGSIVNIGSLYVGVSPDVRMYDHLPGELPFIKPPAYGASKSALFNLTRYFATHWAPAGVRVNLLSPGGVLGGQDEEFKRKFAARVPLGRLAEASDLEGPLLFLASDASSYVTGVELRVDGGYSAW